MKYLGILSLCTTSSYKTVKYSILVVKDADRGWALLLNSIDGSSLE